MAFASAIKIFQELNIDEGDSVRPAKRRKTVPTMYQDVHAHTYNQLVLFLTGSAQDTPVLTMTGLSTIVKLVSSNTMIIMRLTTSGIDSPLFLKTLNKTN